MPIHLRLTSSGASAITIWAVLAALLAEPLLRGQWAVIGKFGPAVALIAWLMYVFFWSPRLVVATDAAVLRNVWTSLRIPYARITDVRIGLVVKVSYLDNQDRERTTSCWNAPGMPKIGANAPQATGGRNRRNLIIPTSASQVLVDEWAVHADQPNNRPLTHTWNWVEISGCLLLTVSVAARAII